MVAEVALEFYRSLSADTNPRIYEAGYVATSPIYWVEWTTAD